MKRQILVDVHGMKYKPEIDRIDDSVYVLVRLRGNANFQEAIYHRDGRFTQPYQGQDHSITDIVEWTYMPS